MTKPPYLQKIEGPVRSGASLKDIRNRLGITTRDVERLSAEISAAANNQEFAISNPWLTQIENSESVPSIHKLYSLSVIYRVKFTDLLLLYGIDLDNIGKHQLLTRLDKTHRADIEVYDDHGLVTFPVRLDPAFRPEHTTLLSRMIEAWGEIPIALVRHLDIKHHQYGYVGLQDYTMYPIVRPGSFVLIDDSLNKVYSSGWHNEYDRPIYFFELRDGYACSWCELHGKQLLILPHPSSGCLAKTFQFPGEVDILGQVVGVAMRIVPNQGRQPARDPLSLPKQT